MIIVRKVLLFKTKIKLKYKDIKQISLQIIIVLIQFTVNRVLTFITNQYNHKDLYNFHNLLLLKT